MNALDLPPKQAVAVAMPPPDHLVEAATALANLMGSADQQPKSSSNDDTAARSVVSDNEDDGGKYLKDLKSFPLSLLDGAKKREIFPQKLMAILNNQNLSDVISWLPHGRSFVIIRPDVFTEKVLPAYLPPADARSSTKYHSFTRKLNRWGFRQATRGPDTGAFHHPLFRRDQPELIQGMVCQRSRDRSKTTTEVKDNTRPCKRPSSNSSSNVGEVPLITMSVGAPPSTTPSPGNITSPLVVNSCAASVTDDSRSDDSLSESTSAASVCTHIPKGITTDQAVVARSLQQRDELERLRVAKAMLYQSYLEALNNNTGTNDTLSTSR